MPQKYSRLFFFIIIFSTSSACLLFIPYSETKVIYNKDLNQGGGPYNYTSYYCGSIEFPWRAHKQEIFLNMSLAQGNITLKIIDRYVHGYPSLGDNEEPYHEVISTIGFTTTIKLSPPFQECSILISAEENTFFYGEIKVSYLRYASSYGLFFLGVAIILISYYGFSRYKWWRSKY